MHNGFSLLCKYYHYILLQNSAFSSHSSRRIEKLYSFNHIHLIHYPYIFYQYPSAYIYIFAFMHQSIYRVSLTNIITSMIKIPDLIYKPTILMTYMHLECTRKRHAYTFMFSLYSFTGRILQIPATKHKG